MQQGRRLPLFIFEMLTSTLRSRVSGLSAAFTHRTHSHRAIGVMSLQTPLIFGGAEASAKARSGGTFGSGRLPGHRDLDRRGLTWADAGCLLKGVGDPHSSGLNCPSGSSTVWNSTPSIVPLTATCPRDGKLALATSGNRNTVVESIVDSVASNWTPAWSVG